VTYTWDARLSRNARLKCALFVPFGGHVRGGGSRGEHANGAQSWAAPSCCILRVRNDDTTRLKFRVSEALFRGHTKRAHIGAYQPHPMSSAGRIAPRHSQGYVTRKYEHSKGSRGWMLARVPHFPWSFLRLYHRQPCESPRATHSHNLSCARMINCTTHMHFLMSKCHHASNSSPQMSLSDVSPKEPVFHSMSQFRTSTR
jgi:hypothetical protein